MKPSITHHQNLIGYETLSIMYEGKRTLIYRAQRTADQTPVVLKTSPKNLALRFSDHLNFRNQFSISHHLDHPGIVRILSLESIDNTYVLVMEDGQEISLAEFLQSSVSLN